MAVGFKKGEDGLFRLGGGDEADLLEDATDEKREAASDRDQPERSIRSLGAVAVFIEEGDRGQDQCGDHCTQG